MFNKIKTITMYSYIYQFNKNYCTDWNSTSWGKETTTPNRTDPECKINSEGQATQDVALDTVNKNKFPVKNEDINHHAVAIDTFKATPGAVRDSIRQGYQSSFVQLHAKSREPLEDIIDPCLQKLPINELVSLLEMYLHTTKCGSFVSAYEEAKLFGTLYHRIDEVEIAPLLLLSDLVWNPTIYARYSKRHNEILKNRLLQEGPHLTGEQVCNAIITLGMSSSFHKDLEIFQALGNWLVQSINTIKDTSLLVNVLSAFNKAAILPPETFVGVIGRRFPVLNKHQALLPSEAYNAFSNIFKMQYPMMNPYRFLADILIRNVLASSNSTKKFAEEMYAISKTSQAPNESSRSDSVNVTSETVGKVTISSDDGTLVDISDNIVVEDDIPEPADPERSQRDKPCIDEYGQVTWPIIPVYKSQSLLEKERNKRTEQERISLENLKDKTSKIEYLDKSFSQLSNNTANTSKSNYLKYKSIRKRNRVREQFIEITQVKPSQFIKMLFVLSRLGAPRQQYLRPFTTHLLMPMIPYFTPPTFSKLICTLRNFGCDDKEFLAAMLNRLVLLGPEQVSIFDLIESLRMISKESVPLEAYARSETLDVMTRRQGVFSCYAQ